jgi:hypothetical protein
MAGLLLIASVKNQNILLIAKKCSPVASQVLQSNWSATGELVILLARAKF